MQIKKNNSSKKKILIIITVLLVVALGSAAAFAYIHTKSPANQTESTKQEKKQQDSDRQQAKSLEENPESKTKNTNSDKPPEPTTNSSTGKKQVVVTASTDTSGGTVYIRGRIDYPVSSGSCYAQLSGPSGQSIRKDTILLQNPASTDCKTISIPASELAAGKWTFTLHYTSDEYEGASVEVPFSI